MSESTTSAVNPLETMAEESFVRELVREGNASVRTLVKKFLPIVIARHGGEDLEAMETGVEKGRAEFKKLKSEDASKPVKLIGVCIYALYACGFHTAEQIAELLTKAATPALIDKALAYMPVWAMIFNLKGAGMIAGSGKLTEARTSFRGLFFRAGDTALKAKQAAREVFHVIVDQSVLDSTYVEFVTGQKAQADVVDGSGRVTALKGSWIIKPRLQKYLDAVKNRDNGGSGNPDLYREQMTVEKVIEFNNSEIDRLATEATNALSAAAA